MGFFMELTSPDFNHTLSAPSPTEILVRFPEIGETSRAIERLKAGRVFAPAADFNELNCKVGDPDGRPVILSDPSPFA
jgi:hypothetical protein